MLELLRNQETFKIQLETELWAAFGKLNNVVVAVSNEEGDCFFALRRQLPTNDPKAEVVFKEKIARLAGISSEEKEERILIVRDDETGIDIVVIKKSSSTNETY